MGDGVRTMSAGSMPRATALGVLGGVGMALCALALTLHSPGHISFDSSMQVHESATGIAVSWNPPFMSALLRWLGGNALAPVALMLLNIVGVYGCLFTIARSSMRASPDTTIESWRVVLCALLVANPVIFLYVGILWKDVLMATLMLLALTLALQASRARGRRQSILIALAVLALLPMPLTRQQGWFLLPILLVAPAWLFVRQAGTRKQSLLRMATIVLLTMAAMAILSFAVGRTIRGGDGRDVSNGTRAVMGYDIAGAIARSRSAGQSMMNVLQPPSRVWEHLTERYSAARSDGLINDSIAGPYLGEMKPSRLRHAWWTLVRDHPGEWLRQRTEVFAWLLDMHDLQQCLPIHVGIDGMPDYMDEMHIRQGSDARDDALFAFAKRAETTPLYRHWFYALLLPIALLVAWRARSLGPARGVLIVHLVGLLAYLLSFLPTSIACDFRYLYPLIPNLGGVLIVLLLAPRTGK
jgi:hypothetical protein